jgi:tetratricopeptide (TPR) repeat protein
MSQPPPPEPQPPPTTTLLPTLEPPPSGSNTAGETHLTLGEVAPAAPDALPVAAGRYLLISAIGQGGMGAVWRAHDPDLKRPLAVKVMLGQHRDRPDLEARFLEEAQITGQLQHPCIPPVHEIGRLGDGRPFFAMKLIEGRTLAELLQQRTSPAEDLPRFLAIFGQICQALGYAHQKGVLHRDLKPSNVMVGAFGEVQVMDWGLAKILTGGGGESCQGVISAGAVPACPSEDSGRTQAGSVLGTPAFMAPEQARGEIDRVDERADVFGLGAILCVILTAEPPFRGPDGSATLAEAARGDLADAFARLEACDVDAELLRLAKRCLAPDREERLREGQAVAEAINAYQAGVQERLRTAELERTRAEVKVGEERKRRRLTLALAGAVLAVLLLGGGAAWWSSHQQTLRDAEETRQRERRGHDIEAGLRQAEALQRQARWDEAGAALTLAGRRAAEDATGESSRLVEQARQRLAFVRRLTTIRLDKSLVVGGKQNKASAPPAYAATFREHGLPVKGPVEELARQITAFPLREQLLAALEDWALGEPDDALRARLWQLTEEVDRQPWRRALRDKDVWRDRQKLTQVAAGLDLARLSPAFLVGLGEKLETLGGDGITVLEQAWKRHPSDFWLNFALADALNSPRRQRWDEAVGYYRAALALRPDSPVVHHNLGGAFYARKDLDAAEAAFRRAVELAPRLAPSVMNLGVIRYDRNDLDGALTLLREAADLDPSLAAAHTNLGNALRRKLDLKGALAAYHRAIAADPNYHPAYGNLGLLLASQNQFQEAITTHRKAVALAPQDPNSHWALGNAFFLAQRWPDAITAFREAVRLAPRDAPTRLCLGQALYFKGDREEAIGVLRQARELAPGDRSTSAFLLHAHRGLGYELLKKRDWDGSVTASRQALALDPGDPTANMNLVQALFQGGRFAETCAACRTALKSMRAGQSADDGPRQVVAWTLKNAEPLRDAERQLPGVLGETRPQTAGEWLWLARLCKQYRNRPAAAARFYASAFTADPRLTAGPPMPSGNRYHAACAASLAASGKGADAGKLDETEGARLRQQALGWLRAELTAWDKLAGNKEARPRLEQALLAWQKDEELAGLRETEHLAKLPKAERTGLLKFWEDVAGLLRRARPS